MVAETLPGVKGSAVATLQRHLDEHRHTRAANSLWQAAAERAQQHGVCAVALLLRPDYTKLKQRLGAPRREPNKAAFVELITLRPAEECVIEFESPRGGQMRIHWMDSHSTTRVSRGT